MNTDSEKLDLLISEINLIKNHFKIVPDKEIKIYNQKSNLLEYEDFAKNILKLNKNTIKNQLSILSRFLKNSQGKINKKSVKEYLESNDSDSWKSNQLKALRRYCRDFLFTGNWINDFQFPKTSAKIKKIPSDEELIIFYKNLDFKSKLVFTTLLDSGLRIGEVLNIKIKNIDFENNMIDASNMHKGNTKHSWISFVTSKTIKQIRSYLDKRFSNDIDLENNLFTIHSRTLQNTFKKISLKTGITINPHLLRTVFSEKCTLAGIKDKYVDAFCGRVSQGVLATNYTDYSPQSLRREYDKVESLLKLDFE